MVSDSNRNQYPGAPGQESLFNAADVFAQAEHSMASITEYWGPIPWSEGSGFYWGMALNYWGMALHDKRVCALP